MSLIRVQNASVRFGQKLMLREVLFRLREGERIGLIGENGSGKTTFLRLLVGRIEPTEGRIERTEGLKVGYLSQFSELSDDRTAGHHMEDQFSVLRPVRILDRGPDRPVPGPEARAGAHVAKRPCGSRAQADVYRMRSCPSDGCTIVLGKLVARISNPRHRPRCHRPLGPQVGRKPVPPRQLIPGLPQNAIAPPQIPPESPWTDLRGRLECIHRR
jgi:energy-coupling factor transporter ATP-binding protein EcfA2